MTPFTFTLYGVQQMVAIADQGREHTASDLLDVVQTGPFFGTMVLAKRLRTMGHTTVTIDPSILLATNWEN